MNVRSLPIMPPVERLGHRRHACERPAAGRNIQIGERAPRRRLRCSKLILTYYQLNCQPRALAQGPITSEAIRKLNLIRLNGPPGRGDRRLESGLFSVDYHFDCVWTRGRAVLALHWVVWRCSRCGDRAASSHIFRSAVLGAQTTN